MLLLVGRGYTGEGALASMKQLLLVVKRSGMVGMKMLDEAVMS